MFRAEKGRGDTGGGRAKKQKEVGKEGEKEKKSGDFAKKKHENFSMIPDFAKNGREKGPEQKMAQRLLDKG